MMTDQARPNDVVTIPSRKDIRSFLRSCFIPPRDSSSEIIDSIHNFRSRIVNKTILWIQNKMARRITMHHRAIENYLRYTYNVDSNNATFNYHLLVERIFIVLYGNRNNIPLVRTRTPGANSDWLNQLDETQQDNLLDRNEHGLLPHALPNPSRRQLEVEPHPINQNERHEIDFVNEKKEEENLSDRLESEVKPPPVNFNNEERKDDEAISVSEGMDDDNLSHQSELEVKPHSVNLNNKEGKEKESIYASEGIDQEKLSVQSEFEVKPPSVNLNNEEGKDMIKKVEPFDDAQEDDNLSTPIDDNLMDIESIKAPEDHIDVEMEYLEEVKPPTPEITPEAKVEVIGFSTENELLDFEYDFEDENKESDVDNEIRMDEVKKKMEEVKPLSLSDSPQTVNSVDVNQDNHNDLKVKPHDEFTDIACVGNETKHDTPVVKQSKDQTDLEVIATLSETTTMEDLRRIQLHQKHRILKYIMNKLDFKANKKGTNTYSSDERLLLLAKDMRHFLIDNNDFCHGMIIKDNKVQPKISQVKPASIPTHNESLSKRKSTKNVVEISKKNKIGPLTNIEIVRARNNLDDLKASDKIHLRSTFSSNKNMGLTQYNEETYLQQLHKQFRSVGYTNLTTNHVPEQFLEPFNDVSHFFEAQKEDAYNNAMRETLSWRKYIVDERIASAEEESSDSDDTHKSDATNNDSDSEIEVEPRVYDDDLPSEKIISLFLKKIAYENHVWDIGFHLKAICNSIGCSEENFMKKAYCPCSGLFAHWFNQHDILCYEKQYFFKSKRCSNKVFGEPSRLMEHLYDIGLTKGCLLHRSFFYYLFYLYNDDVRKMNVFKTFQKTYTKKVSLNRFIIQYKTNCFLNVFSIKR